MNGSVESGRVIERELTVPASLDYAYQTVSEPDSWRRWLIEEGEIETLPDGWLHLKWSMGASVRVKILASSQNDFVRTEWYAPSEPGRTIVTFSVTPQSSGPLIKLTETGFGYGPDWDRCYEQTNEVWDFALGRLEEALSV
jgi:uncharacterized protein YndB with AHSA1/START domain